MYGFIFFRDNAWVTVIIDESVSIVSHLIACLTLRIVPTVCYTPEFQNLKNSGLASKSYITTTRTYLTSLLGKVESHCISRNQEQRAKLGYHSSKRHMRSYMATTRICWEDRNAMRLRTSLGKSWFSVMSRHNVPITSSSRGVSTVLQSKVCFYNLSFTPII